MAFPRVIKFLCNKFRNLGRKSRPQEQEAKHNKDTQASSRVFPRKEPRDERHPVFQRVLTSPPASSSSLTIYDIDAQMPTSAETTAQQAVPEMSVASPRPASSCYSTDDPAYLGIHEQPPEEDTDDDDPESAGQHFASQSQGDLALSDFGTDIGIAVTKQEQNNQQDAEEDEGSPSLSYYQTSHPSEASMSPKPSAVHYSCTHASKTSISHKRSAGYWSLTSPSSPQLQSWVNAAESRIAAYKASPDYAEYNANLNIMNQYGDQVHPALRFDKFVMRNNTLRLVCDIYDEAVERIEEMSKRESFRGFLEDMASVQMYRDSTPVQMGRNAI